MSVSGDTKSGADNLISEFYSLILKSELFSRISEESLPGLLSCLSSKVCKYKRAEYIAIEGEKFEGVGFVLSGEVSVIKESFRGSKTIMANFKAGDIFGEIIAFSGTGLWPSTVVAQSDCEIMFIRPEKMLGFCDKICDFHRIVLENVTRIISQKALILNRKVDYLTIKSMKAKLSKYLLEEYKRTGSSTFTLSLNREKLAEFLNVSRPSMSRELCKMRDDGIIEFYRETVKILDVEALEEYTEDG